MLDRMKEAMRNAMSVDQFLAWAERQPERPRYELINGAPTAMAPERAAHARTKHRIARALEDAIGRAGLKCVLFPDGMTVPIDQHTAYEPEALVHCGDPIAGNSVMIADPVIVVEVASTGTRNIDAGVKLAGYFTVSSVVHYLIVDPERELIVHHRRESGGNIATMIVPQGALTLHPPGLTITTAEIFPAG
jgi:Uma2 family endonuclease